MPENLPPDQPERPDEATTQQHAAPPGPPPPEPPASRRFLRSRTDRMLAGVAGGLGRHLDVDPMLVRIGFVALALFGGAGVLLYLAAALLVPTEETAGAPGAVPAPGGERNRALVILGIVALVLIAGPLLLGPALIAGGLLVPIAFLVLAGLVVAWLVTGERPARDAGSLVRATIVGLGVLFACWVLAAGAFWAAAAGGEAVIAGIVIAAGVAVLAAAFVRPARWLVLPALALALPAAFVSATNIELDGGYGERTYRPANVTQLADGYEIGMGQLTVDLRDADLPAGDERLQLDVGIGEAVLIVPDDVCVATDASLGIGGVDVFDRDGGGVDLDYVDAPDAAPGGTRLLVDADIGIGHLDVRSTDPSFDDDFRFGGERGPFFELGDEGRGTNAGCA